MEVIVRLLAVAHCVFSFCDVDGLVRHHLYVLAVQDTVSFLGNHVCYPGLACVEIVPELLHGVGLSLLLHGRHAYDSTGRILCPSCKHSLGLHVVFHIVSCKLHPSVCHRDISVVVDHTLAVCEVLDYRITGSSEGRHIKGALVEKCDRISPGHRIGHKS